MLFIITTALLGVLFAAALIILLIQRIRFNSTLLHLEKQTEKLISGDLSGNTNDDKDEKTRSSRHLKEAAGRIHSLIDFLVNKTHEGERASTRLSRNIQKALQYTASISVNTQNNRETSEKLYNYVTEGSAAVEEIHASIRSLKDQVVRQNSEIEQTSAAINGINDSLRQVAEISSDRMDETRTLADLTSLGKEKILQSDEKIRTVQDKVGDVLSLITVINKIASQTNLLAMNAAIEAAHAGSAGKGFAVVAEEIRNLAESTSSNAKSISETLKTLVEHIEAASELSRENGVAFNRIEEVVSQVSESLDQINSNTMNVFKSTQDVVHSSEILTRISQTTSISMDEIEVGAKEINTTLDQSKQVAQDLDSHMEALSEETKNINLITTKITSSYLASSRSQEDILESLYDFKGGSFSGDLSTLKRIRFSNLILAHINWVARVRAVMDKRIEAADSGLTSTEHCELGLWLKSPESSEVLSSGKSDQLKKLHSDLHKKAQDMIGNLHNSKREDLEEDFQELTDLSIRIIQILTTLGYTEFVQWEDGLSVNIEKFDNQHKKLIALINSLYQNMERGDGDDVLMQTLNELIQYTDTHFSAEEDAFKEFGYPEAEMHKEQHGILLRKASELQSNFKAGRSVLTNEVLDFLQDWVLNHIVKVDKHYSDFLKDKIH